MASTDKNIVITPNRGSNNDPSVVFTGNANIPVTLNVSNNNSLLFSASGSNVFSLTTTGNVGVGTGSPSNRLNVYGNIAISNTTTISGIIFSDGTFQNTASAPSAFSASNITITSTNTNSTFYPTFVEATSGNIGIRADSNLTFNPATNQLSLTGNIFAQNSIQTGNLSITNTTASTNSATGALVVGGGAGIANKLFVGSTISGQSLDATAVGNITPSSGQFISAIIQNGLTAAVINANTSVYSPYLNATTSANVNGLTSNTSVIVNGAVESISTGTGALVVTGGVGIGKSLFVGNSLTVQGNTTVSGNLWVHGNIYATSYNEIMSFAPVIELGVGNAEIAYNGPEDRGVEFHYVSQTGGNAFGFFGLQKSTEQFLFVTNAYYSGGADTDIFYGPPGSAVFGNITIGDATVNNLANPIPSTSTSTGALIIQKTGGIGVGGNINAGGNIYAVGNITVGNGAIISGNVGIGTATATGYTNNALAIFGNTLNNGNIYITNKVGQSGIYFPDGTVQTTYATGTAIAITDDTTTNATRYLTFISSSTGTLSTINTSSTKLTYNPLLATITLTGGNLTVSNSVQFGNLSITNTTASSSTTTGAVTIGGGLGVGGALYVGGLFSGATVNATSIYSSGPTNAAGTASFANIISNGFVQGTSLYSSGPISAVGNASFANLASNGYVIAASISSSGAISATGAITGSSLTSNTNVTVANSAWVGNLAVTNTTITTSTTTGAVTIAGGIGIANGAVIAGNVGVGTSSTIGYTNNALAVFGNSLHNGNIYITNKVGQSGIYFPDGTVQTTYATGTAIAITDDTTTNATRYLTFINTSTGALSTINTSSTKLTYNPLLATITLTGGNLTVSNSVQFGNLSITNTTASSSTTTGAVTIGGGLGVGGALYVGGLFSGAAINGTSLYSSGPINTTGLASFANLISNGFVQGTSVYSSGPISTVGNASFANLISNGFVQGTSLYSSGPISAVGNASFANIISNGFVQGTSLYSSGPISAVGNASFANLTSNGYITATSISSTGAISATGTITAASFTSNTNVTVANSAWIGNLAVTNTTATTSTTTGAVTVRGGVGIANGAVIAGNVGIGTSSTTGYTNNALAVFGNTLLNGNVYLTNNVGQSGIYFPDGTVQTTYATGTAITITDDTTTNATRYLTFVNATSGTLSTINTSSTKLTYNPLLAIITLTGGNLTVTNSTQVGNLAVTNITASTSTTTGALTVAGGASIASNLFVGGSVNGANVNVTGTNAPPIGIFAPATNTLGFATGSTEAMRIDQYGNVSIGTSVIGYGSGQRKSVTISGTNESLLAFYTGGAARSYIWSAGNWTYLTSETGGGGMSFTVKDASSMFFYTTNTERMRITAAGSVGIGTSPIAPFDVAVPNSNSYVNITTLRAANDPTYVNYSRMLFGQIGYNRLFIETGTESNLKGTTMLQPFGGNVVLGNNAFIYTSNTAIITYNGNINITNTNPTTSTTSGALNVAGGVGIGNGAVIAGNVGVGTTTTVGYTNNALAVFGNSQFKGNIFVTNAVGQSGIYFPDGTTQTTAASGSSITVTDDTTTNATRYLTFVSSTSGTLSTINTSSTKLTYNPLLATVTLTGGNLAVSNSTQVGNLSITNTTASTSTSTGALTVAGGVGIGGSLFVNNRTNTDLLTANNIYSALTINAAGNAVFNTLTSNGYIVGTSISSSGTISAASAITALAFTSNTNVTIANSAWIGNISVTNTTAATSTTSGAVTVAGGVGIAGNIYVGGIIFGSVNTAINSSNLTVIATSTDATFYPVFAEATSGNLSARVDSNLTFNPNTNQLSISSGNALISNSVQIGNLSVTNTTASTSSTTGALIIQGGAAIASNLFVGGSINGANVNVTGSNTPPNGIFLVAANTLGLATGSTERLRITSGGAVGVGTTVTGNGTLTVYGTYSAAGIDSSGMVISDSAYNGTENRRLVIGPSSSTESMLRFFKGDLTFRNNNGVENVRITQAGLVGIGTNTPLALLHVSNGNTILSNSTWVGNLSISNTTAAIDSTAGALYVAGGAAIASNLFVGGSINGANVNVTGSNTPPNGIWLPAANNLGFASGSTERMRIDSVGNIGIGMSSPQTILTIGSATPGTGEATQRGQIQLATAHFLGLNATGGVEFKTSATGAGYGYKIAGTDIGGGTGLFIGSRAGTAAWTEVARFSQVGGDYFQTSVRTFLATGSGSVGIGTNVITASARQQIEGNLWVGNSSAWFGNIAVTNTTTSTSTTTGALTVSGGVGVAGNIYAGGTIFGIANTAINASNIVVTSTTTNATFYPVFVEGVTGNIGMRSDTGFNYNPSTDTVGIGTVQTLSRLNVGGNSMVGSSATAELWPTTSGVPQSVSQVTKLRFRATFDAYAVDQTPRITSQIITGFNGGTWGKEYLAIGVGNLLGSSNDTNLDPTERMRITITGIGIGTTAPTQNLDVNGTTLFRSNIQIIGNIFSTASALVGNLTVSNTTQSTSTTTGAVINLGGEGISGNLFVGGSINGANINVTGSNAPPVGIWLPAANTLGFATGSTERMRLDSNGNLSTTGANATLGFKQDFGGNLRVAGNIVATSEITAYFSDSRLKTNVTPITNAVNLVMAINGVYYNPNEIAVSLAGENKDSHKVGLLAQEVEKVLPQVIKHAPFDIGDNGSSKSGQYFKTLQYDKMIPLLVEAIKELKIENNKLRRDIEQIKQRLN